MRALRTPDERFIDIPDFPWPPRHVEVAAGDGTEDRLRMAFVDAGPPDAAEVILLVHGEPSWGFLYRHVIPPLVAAGHRCIAPDLIGFGRSDKPAARSDYTYLRHVEWLREALFDRLGLDGITLVCQDWGGLLGLRLVGEHHERFRRVVAANTFLPAGETPSDAFLRWQRFSQEVPELPVGRIIQGGTVSTLPDDVVAAYDAPFPDEGFKEGARQFPLLVPTSEDDPAVPANRRAWATLEQFDRPFLCAFSDQDPVTAGADRHLIRRIPGAQGQAHVTLAGGGHFLQEDVPDALAEAILRFVRAD